MRSTVIRSPLGAGKGRLLEREASSGPRPSSIVNTMVDINETPDDAPDRRTVTHHVHYDPASDASASETLVAAVADIDDTGPLELEPLYETLDPDVIDDFVSSERHSDVGGNVSFAFAGYDVRVHASGLLEIEPGD